MFGIALKQLVIGTGITVGVVLMGVVFTGTDTLKDTQAKAEQTVDKYNQLKDKYLHEVATGNAVISGLLKEVDRANKEIQKANCEVKDTGKKVHDTTKPVIEDDLSKLPTVIK